MNEQQLSEKSLDEARELHRAGEAAAAEPIYRRILAEQPEHPDALHLLGVVELQCGNAPAAIDLIEQAIAAKPDEAAYHNNLGNALMASGAAGQAEAAFRRATELDATGVGPHFNRAVALHADGRHEAAEDAYHRTLSLDADHLGALNNLGRMLRLQGRAEEAVDLLRRAVALSPDSFDRAATLAVALEAVDALDEAREVARRVLAQSPGHPVGNLVSAILDHRAGRFQESRARLEKLLAGGPGPAIAANAEFELGQAYDRLGDADAAFAAFSRANTGQSKLPEAEGANPQRYVERLRRNRAYFTRERVAGWERIPGGDERPAPVFFVGFPRSGTTLMETMLRAHPRLATTGERSPLREVRRRLLERHGGAAYPACVGPMGAAEADEARGWFWDHAEGAVGAAPSRRLVDKLPLNIVELGLAARLFPDAPVVMALRDPRDAVLSCFMREFEPNDAMAHFNTLDGAAHLYAAVMELWLQYREDLGLRILEYRYEDLIAAPDPTARTIIEFIGEPWSDAVLDYRTSTAGRRIDTPSRERVAEPLSARAIGRWRAYQAHLAPVLPRLDPFVRAFGYDAGTS